MSDSGDPALIGRRVAGKFLVEKFLGGGAMGAVYRARDTTLDRNVALKVMHPAIAVDPSFVNRFHREARAASRLDHPSSMRVIEYGEEPDGLLYIAMEYLEGRDLYKVIHEDWPLSVERISDILMKALSAITMAHEMGVIHRDLKPENIMILNRKDDEGRDNVKVCDFGIAKITERDDEEPGGRKTAGAKLTTAGLVVGTPEYMSPEQARGEKLDARSDLYSMGIILYQLLTGRTPFLADTALAVVLKHISEPPAPPRVIYPAVHKGLEQVCLRALAKIREERFQSARDMRAAIKAALEGRALPVDSEAATLVAAPSGSMRPPTTGPGAPQTTKMTSAPPGRHPYVNPAIAGSSGVGKVTPLGTATSSPDEPRSKIPFVLVALVALAIGGGGFAIYKKGGAAAFVGSRVEPTTTAAPVESGSPRPVTPAPSTPSSISPVPSTELSPAPPPDPKGKGHSIQPPRPNATPDPKAGNATTAAAQVVDPPAPPPAPPPEPQPSVAPPPPPTPVPPPAPAPAPAFNAQTCRAVLLPHRSASAYSAKDLSFRGTDAAWTACAKSSIHDKPAGPIAATVRVLFNDNKVFKGATCSGCPGALAACISSSTKGTVAVTFKSGDATGDPAFDVPVSITCE